MPRDPSLTVWKDRGSAEWCSTECGGKREKRQKRRGRKERRDGDGGREEIKNGGERESKKERRVEKQERGRGRSQGQCEDSVVL